MIAVDTSALVAVVLGEPDAERLLDAMRTQQPLVSAVSLVEAGIVVETRQGADAARDLELLLAGINAQFVPVDQKVAVAAIHAWRRFGKGRHPSGLNFGDCFSYATAHLEGVPLLFRGEDFSQTDIAGVEY